MSAGLTAGERENLQRSVRHAEVGRQVPLQMKAPTRGKPPTHWAEMAGADHLSAVAEMGLPAFRAEQLNRHLFTHFSQDPADWTDIPLAERQELARRFFPSLLTPVRDAEAEAGTTVKTLWRLHDAALVESVLMRYGVPGVPASGPGRTRATVCISSQAGCGMACPFCATGQGGLQRNLSTGEILAQVIAAAKRLRDGRVPGGPGRVTNVVFMGMGEPLANFNAVVAAIGRIVSAPPTGLGISARGVTVSTVGLVAQIDRLGEVGLPITLAVSLHAPDDELRDTLCPINTRWPVAEVVAAARRYFEATGRRVSIEYALIRDVNDQAWRAEALAELLNKAGRGWVHVNLIPLNPTPGSKWTASSRADQAAFVRTLEAARLPVTVRDTRGREIDGACGQLAATGG